MIVEPKNPQPAFFQVRVSFSILFFAFRLEMLSSIKFDDQAGFRTIKIHYVFVDDSLSVKTGSTKLFSTQPGPKKAFSFRHITAEFTDNRG